MDKTQKRLIREWLSTYWSQAAKGKFSVPSHVIDKNVDEITKENSDLAVHWIIDPQLQTFAGFISHQTVSANSGKKAVILDKIFVEPSYNKQNLEGLALAELINHWKKNSFESVAIRIYDDFTRLNESFQALGFQKINTIGDMTLGRQLKLNEWCLNLKANAVSEHKHRS